MATSATQHDSVNYGANYTWGRGNLVLEQRYDVETGTATEWKYGYLSTGTLYWTIDPQWHQIRMLLPKDGPGRDSDPPNPVPVVDLRKRMINMLSNSRCANFVAQLLATVSRRNPSNSLVNADPLKVWDMIASSSQRGFSYTSERLPSGREASYALGSIGTGTAGIAFAASYATNTDGISRRMMALAALHETIHHAGTNTYSDRQLAEAVHEMRANLASLPAENDLEGNSNFWNGALNAACLPPVGGKR
jgi:hypothetical protein